MVLARDPLCVDPFGLHRMLGETVAADMVDHIVPLRAGGTHAFSNLQPMCWKCHARKTARDGSFGE